MNLKDLFHRKRSVPVGRTDGEPQPLRIEGIDPAPLTPEPDDAELAAQALLEMMSEQSLKDHLKDHHKDSHKDTAAEVTTPSHSGEGRGGVSSPRDAKYYKDLATRIRQAHEAARLRTIRFLAFCEQELKKPHLPAYGPGSLGLLEAELYKRIDIIDRYGGDLKRRWQHCLADVTVRLMKLSHTDSTDNED